MLVDHEVIVIGGGSGGYAAARTARAAGADVAIVDPGPLGGLCILRGCMPSKAMLRCSDILALMRRAGEFGLRAEGVGADLAAIVDRKDRLVAEFAEYRVAQLRTFPLYEDYARFLSPTRIQVGGRTLTARSFVVATGSVVDPASVPGLAAIDSITSDQALDLRQPPASMLVLGGGPVACELAQFFQRIGVAVTLLQRGPHLLSQGDQDLARPLEDAFRQEGMQVFTGTRLERFTEAGGLKVAHFTHGGQERTAAAPVVFEALGRRPNLDGLDLAAAGVAVDGHRIAVDRGMRTSQPHIFAVGDVTGQHEIVHVAIQQGEVAGHNATHPDGPARDTDTRIPLEVVFTDPQVATVGLSEKACQAQGIPYRVASYPFDDHGKSICLGSRHGLAKVLCDPPTGQLLGGGICGPEAGELIHELAAVLHFHGTVGDLARIPHYHPTLAEILTIPAEQLLEQVPEKAL